VKGPPEFTSLLIHDLRNTTSAVRVNLEFIDHAHALAGDLLEALKDARTATERLHRAFDLLWIMNELESGTYDAPRVRVDLGALVEGTVHDLRDEATHKEIRLESNLSDEACAGDPRLLRCALEMLLENALRCCPGKGSVCVTIRRRGPLAELSVRDTGSPLDAGAREAVFQKHWPGDRRGICGLGPYFCRMIATWHGGQAWVDEEEGGHCFHLSLPRPP
jgi:signal transduction histidine kinase